MFLFWCYFISNSIDIHVQSIFFRLPRETKRLNFALFIILLLVREYSTQQTDFERLLWLSSALNFVLSRSTELNYGKWHTLMRLALSDLFQVNYKKLH